MEQLHGRAVGTIAQTHFVSEYVGGTGGQGAERYRRPGDAVDSLIDGAIATRGQDEIAAVFNRRARQLPGLVGSGGGVELHLPAGFAEDLDGIVQTHPLTSSQPAGERIVNDANLME